jgi:hypothetical protein
MQWWFIHRSNHHSKRRRKCPVYVTLSLTCVVIALWRYLWAPVPMINLLVAPNKRSHHEVLHRSSLEPNNYTLPPYIHKPRWYMTTSSPAVSIKIKIILYFIHVVERGTTYKTYEISTSFLNKQVCPWDRLLHPSVQQWNKGTSTPENRY